MTDGSFVSSSYPLGRVVVRGTISSSAFASGDRFVIGHWPMSPIGPMADVMWTRPDDRRVLLAPNDETASFISRIYAFDEVVVGPLDVQSDGRRTTVSGAGLSIDLQGGRLRPVPFPRPLIVTRLIEAPIARALMGVNTVGVSPTGAREWYQTRGWRWVSDGTAQIDDEDLGPPVAFTSPVGVGFSEPPRRPSIVSVNVTIDLQP